MKKLFLGLLLIAFVFGQKTYNVTQANFMGDVDVADTLTAKIASVSDSLHVDSLSIGKVVSDVDMDGNYTLNSPSLTDLRSNALPSPYYRFDGSNDRIDLDGLATELAVVSNTTWFYCMGRQKLLILLQTLIEFGVLVILMRIPDFTSGMIIQMGF